jgi:hypothetical protein
MFNKIQKNIKKEKLKEENRVIPNQIDLIESLLSIIARQLSNIDDIGRNDIVNNNKDEHARTLLLVTKRGYLDFYQQILSFLLEKIKVEKIENFKFYLPNLRTLFDIYSRLLFLANMDTDNQMLNCVCEKLLYFKKFSMKELFDDDYKYNLLLFDKKYKIPSYENFSKKLVKDYLFPPVEQIIKPINVNNFKPYGMNEKFELAEAVYKMYRYLSGYVHGNILNKNTYGNEYLWIIRNVTFLSTLVLKVVEEDILDNRNKIEIEHWAMDFKRHEPELQKFHIRKTREQNKNFESKESV